MRRTIGIAAAGALAATGLGLTGPAQAAAPRTTAMAQAVATDFGLGAHAFGTKLDRNRVLASGETANSVIGCTTLAGLRRGNYVARVDAGPLLNASEIRSTNSTAKSGQTVAVTSRSTVTSGSLLGGDVKFRGVSSESRTWHNSTGFHNEVSMEIAALRVNGNPVTLTGRKQVIDVGTAGQLTIFERHTRGSAQAASARGVVLKLVVLGGARDGTRIRVGNSYSKMYAGVYGPMSGSTWGSQAKLGNDVASGRTAFQPMPCQGTDGNVNENTTTGIEVPDVVSADVIATHVMGIQRAAVQRGYTRAEIADATVGPAGALVLSGIVSKANVTRDHGALSRSASGTHLLTATLGGTDIRDELIAGQSVTFAGGMEITYRKVTAIPNGIDVVALEIVLADNTRIELGHSIMRIKKH